MADDAFQDVEKMLRGGRAGDAFDYLADRFREEKNYPLLFEARMMKARHELHMPLISVQTPGDLAEDVQRKYDEASAEAAREVGGLFLAAGQISRSWPYFRAIGESGPIFEAIDRLETTDDAEAIADIAFHQGVHPRKGFELILENQGICRAITCFGQYPAGEGREESAKLLVETLHGDIVGGMKRVIEKQEGSAPASEKIPELIAGRDWLFEGGGYYADTSHVCSVIQFGTELHDPETLRRIVELTEYGKQLSEMFQTQGEAPFENLYEDFGIYLRALLGEDVDGAIRHFRGKLEAYSPDEVGSYPAQMVVKFLVRLGRTGEAVEIFERFLTDADPQYLSCPDLLQLHQLGRKYAELQTMARQRGDLLSFTAAMVQDPSV